MEEQLIKKFETAFKPVDKKVKEEEIILFLDKQTPNKFDRETFNDLKLRIQDRGQDLTPLNFARTYFHAYELLEVKRQRAFVDQNHIDRMSQRLKQDRSKPIYKIEISGIQVENSSDSSNYFTFEYSPDYAINVYNFSDTEKNSLIVSGVESEDKIPIRVTLNNPQGKMIDSKNVTLTGKATAESAKAKFNDGSILQFLNKRSPADLADCQRHLGDLKSKTNEYESFVKTKREYLARTFPDVFSSSFGWKGKKISCGFYLIASCILSLIVGLVAFYLNFTRCMFLDVLVTLSFFSKMYIWRSFNLFLAIKLIMVLFVSICLDLSWEIHKLISFNKNYEETVKVERIKGLVLTGILILCKLALIFFYYKLSRENNSNGFLGLDSEMSINEVQDDQYTVKGPEAPNNILV